VLFSLSIRGDYVGSSERYRNINCLFIFFYGRGNGNGSDADRRRATIAGWVVGRHVSREFTRSPAAMRYRALKEASGKTWLDRHVRAQSQFVWRVVVSMPAECYSTTAANPK
jgi:hypothetical protein